jgi:glycosyltransferase involved in cell wall biosynthesis
MKVGINASILGGRITGIGSYLLNLLGALAELPQGTSPEFVVFGVPDEVRLPKSARLSIVATPKLAPSRRVMWEQLELPRLCREYEVDVLHCPDFARPLIIPVPVVNTIHDLSYYALEDYFPVHKKFYKRAVCRAAMAKSSVLIADSEFTKREIATRFGVDRMQVVVSLLGAPVSDSSPRERSEAPFLLFVGTLEKRKNVAKLVDAYGHIRNEGLPHRLVLVGHPGYGWNEIVSAINRNAFKADIHVRGYLEQWELDTLYRSADLFVFPSRYEGFGLPILEAMSHGCPVVCSRSASLPEVGGDAVEYCNIATARTLAEGIVRVLSSAQRLAELVALGKDRISQFSWMKCAQTHLDAFDLAFGMQRAAARNPKMYPVNRP